MWQSYRAYCIASLAALCLSLTAISPATSDMDDSVDMMWGNTQVLCDGAGHQMVSLSHDCWTTSAFRSKSKYLFGRFDIDIKLVPKDSAGTGTTVYRKGDREMQYRLWFDPTEDFNTYSIIWNPHMILILVNGVPIRWMRNQMRDDTPFPLYQPMRLYASIWDADEWATQGGRIKTDWSHGPFTAFFRNYTANACVPYNRAWICGQDSGDSSWFNQELDEQGQQKLNDVNGKNKIYDYCTDSRRFPNGYPPECGHSKS
ncbi:unnamed protein product [Miscanthus lutarioriparius]|uniref:Xyloglucan endotransglucosylase/hydrolase n=1 Tax=Miscanthus lutarioriparius TaxID=422564 RepID=A0A811R6X6_9POAL|nr:unnamed protein product [Miscanthus lutarioriparius]